MHNIEELHESINDIYYQLDEGKIDREIALDILLRVCKYFIGEDIK